jgi:acetaldehyde dehydrogenase (acetylating)
MADTARSTQQAEDLALRAHSAAQAWADASQDDVNRVTDAMARAGYDAAERLAALACEETGYGRVDHKTFKNIFCSVVYLDRIRDIPTIGVVASDPARGVVEIAEPVGVIAGLVPVTNPTATTLFYAIASVRSRNAIVNAPHPRAVRCIGETTRVLAEAAEAAGAPPGLISAMSEVTLEGTQALMAHYRTDLVLATGSRAMVLAAYSSGKPTYAVGPGNSPSYVHASTRDLGEAAAAILASKTFDNGTACASEQAVIVDASAAAALRHELEQRGGYFLAPAEQDKLGTLLFPAGPGTGFNVDTVGQFATRIAEMAGLTVPASTRALIVAPGGVGRDHLLSHELLCPVLKWYAPATSDDAIATARALLRYGGDGHTAAVWAEDQSVIARYARVPAYRICVNGPTLFGAMGYTTGFVPSFTLGTGTIGGTISSDNIGPQHLVNRKRVGQAIRSWRDSGLRDDGTTDLTASTPRPAPVAVVPGTTIPLPPLPPAQAALMGHTTLPAVTLTPAGSSPPAQPAPPAQTPPPPPAPAAAPPRGPLPLGPAPIDIEALVREAIEEVIAS